MPLIALSREHHAGKRLVPPISYEYARTTAVVALCGAELMMAAQEFPIGFALDGGTVTPIALLFPEPGGNAFVAPDGRWMADYIPAAIRAYPFVLAQSPGSDEKVLCLHDTAVLSDTDGEPLFTETGEPGPLLLKSRDFFIEIERNRAATAMACTALAQRNLLIPWEIKVDKGDGTPVPSSLPLLRLDQDAFNALPSQAVAELWPTGALLVAYTHILSLGRMQRLGHLIALQHPPKVTPPPSAPLDLDRRFGIVTDEAELHFNF